MNPIIIQGGMGAGVSSYKLAKAVSKLGQLGVISGTALDTILIRRLQKGDLRGSIRRALSFFPLKETAQKVIDKYFMQGGKPSDKPYLYAPKFSLKSSKWLQELTVAANFVEVFLSKEGHSGLVGINLLEKIQLPNVYSLYGAMLAGVDYVLMGAGIPKEIPHILDQLCQHQEVSVKIHVESNENNTSSEIYQKFNPKEIFSEPGSSLKRPKFIPIVSTHTLAKTLVRKSIGKIDGFVIENPSAGGHNPPSRNKNELSQIGEPLYGPKDLANLDKIKELGLPFWLAGQFGSPEKLKEALKLGAAGIQVGTAFALSKESGIIPEIKEKILSQVIKKDLQVFTDPKASPTGFPFKVVKLDNSLSEKQNYLDRKRICDLGYLRKAHLNSEGTLDYLCPAEDDSAYLQKGGNSQDTEGRKCLCNGLLANIGLEQIRSDSYKELPLVTAGLDVKKLECYMQDGKLSYSASDVIDILLGKTKGKAIV